MTQTQRQMRPYKSYSSRSHNNHYHSANKVLTQALGGLLNKERSRAYNNMKSAEETLQRLENKLFKSMSMRDMDDLRSDIKAQSAQVAHRKCVYEELR